MPSRVSLFQTIKDINSFPFFRLTSSDDKKNEEYLPPERRTGLK